MIPESFDLLVVAVFVFKIIFGFIIGFAAAVVALYLIVLAALSLWLVLCFVAAQIIRLWQGL